MCTKALTYKINTLISKVRTWHRIGPAQLRQNTKGPFGPNAFLSLEYLKAGYFVEREAKASLFSYRFSSGKQVTS